ncbi:hypothetical protein DL764_004828 [Monosporascus ibericus]|uniref:Uncharacterized protein n=1 Tax=Monosporascus ibericus TaxID=155417 RepID=A0A4Q4TD75_9PEZI|nr:hypothetical protein DL764_004828 [Monosporascus ibericus]
MHKEDGGTARRSRIIRGRLDLPNTPSSHVDPGLWSKPPRPTVVVPKNSGVPAHFLDHVLETSLVIREPMLTAVVSRGASKSVVGTRGITQLVVRTSQSQPPTAKFHDEPTPMSSQGNAAVTLRIEVPDTDVPMLPEREYPSFFAAIHHLATRFRHSYAPFATYNSVAHTIRLFGPDAIEPSPDSVDKREWLFRIEDAYMSIRQSAGYKGLILG